MLRRCVLEVSSSGRSVARSRSRLFAVQKRSSLSGKRGISSASRPPFLRAPAGRGPPGQLDGKSGSSSLLPKVLLGATMVGVAAVIADGMGYVGIGSRNRSDQKTSIESSNVDAVKKLDLEGEVSVVSDGERSEMSQQLQEKTEKIDEVCDSERAKVEKDDPSLEEPAQSRKDEISAVNGDVSPKDEDVHASISEMVSEDFEKVKNGLKQEANSSKQSISEILSENKAGISFNGQSSISETTTEDIGPKDVPTDSVEHETKEPSSLLDSYSLQDEKNPGIPSNDEHSATFEHISTGKETLDTIGESPKDNEKLEDEKIVIDLIQAIHAAEKRQTELDFRVFEEEKRQMKEEYEKELREAMVREVMLAEEAAMLNKELNKEKVKAAATVKMLEDEAEQKLRTELQHKEEEMQDHLKKYRELAKTERNAALANEKASQLERIAEANLHINALCMAFYARSEEAHQRHSVYKLALGALALEDALSKGLPIQAEIDVLRVSLADDNCDVFIDLVLSSLPDETLSNGTDTKLQLNQKFDALKGKIRHFSLIPCGGGGILAHTMAYVASSIKIRESNLSGDGIESTISRVESLLAEGKLSEAADALEGGVSGTEAEGAVQHWVIQARNRAITEQALALLQSYATSISLT